MWMWSTVPVECGFRQDALRASQCGGVVPVCVTLAVGGHTVEWQPYTHTCGWELSWIIKRLRVGSADLGSGWMVLSTMFPPTGWLWDLPRCMQVVHPKWHPIRNIVHYFWPKPYSLYSAYRVLVKSSALYIYTHTLVFYLGYKAGDRKPT
jgi:hypothetical protein